MQLTEAKRLHRELWYWLEKNPVMDKYEWPRWKRNGGGVPINSVMCFPCAYSEGCSSCCVKWPGVSCVEIYWGWDENNGVYTRWANALSMRRRRRLARAIRLMPWRDELEAKR